MSVGIYKRRLLRLRKPGCAITVISGGTSPSKDCPEPRKPRKMHNQNRLADWKSRLKAFANDILEQAESEDRDSFLQEQIEALVAMNEPEEEKSEDDQVTQATPLQDGSGKGCQPELSAQKSVLEESAMVRGSTAALQPTEVYGYGNFHITALHSRIDVDDPVVSQLREQFLGPEDCHDHVWPAEFQILQQHVAARLHPALCKVRANEGHGLTKMSLNDLGWIVLQAACMDGSISSLPVRRNLGPTGMGLSSSRG